MDSTLPVILIGLIAVATAGVVSPGASLNIDELRVVAKRDMPKDVLQDTGKFLGMYDDDCTESMLITPVKKTADIEPEKDALGKPGNTCHWEIYGAENCIPSLTCKKFNLEPGGGGDDPCEKEYLEVTDGSKGYQKFCGNDGPIGITSDLKLRDFYITLKMSADAKIKKRELKCQVTCIPGKVEGKPLAVNNEPEIDEDCNCGRKPNWDRIVGGEDAKKGEFPWMAALVTAGTRKPFCGGTVINNKFIFTAAHCFKGPYIKAKENMEILLNAHNMDVTAAAVAKGQGDAAGTLTPDQLKDADAKESSVRFKVDRYFIHPLYIRQTNDFDAALIKLDRPIDFKQIKSISPACLPALGSYGESKEGEPAIVAGWGLNSSDATGTMSKLQKLNVEIFKNTECKKFFDARFTRRMLCAGFKEAGKDSCKGDSGGPLISVKKQIWELTGVVSWGEGCAAQNSPGVYVNTREVEQWVRYISNMEDAAWCVE